MGIFWAINMLVLNAGHEAGTKEEDWEEWWEHDKSSLLSTLRLTFLLVFIFLAIQWAIQLQRKCQKSESMDSFGSLNYMKATERYSKVDHISYEIEA